ncbi:MAG: NOP58 family protein [Candidatus Poseidonia sp.]|nr:NOP58 family protein [Poseidonia sp.]
MWLWYDWRAAAVVDDHGNIVDSLEWDGHMTEYAVVERLRQIAAGQPVREAQELKQRFPEAMLCVHGDPQLPEATWPVPTSEQQAVADAAALRLAVEGVQAAANDPDRRLEHLVRGSDELRASHLTMESRLIEWAGLFFPMTTVDDRAAYVRTVAQSEHPAAFAEAMGIEVPAELPSEKEWSSLVEWAEDAAQANGRLDRMEHALRWLAEEHLPSVSALVGPLLAARLCVEAHGRARLARLPSGTVQILGAEKAFFHHLKTGAPPPKHGHIFMHPWISRSPRWVRGKIARMLAGKISIAAKIDAFDGESWGEAEVAKIEERVEALRAANKQPPSRR